MASQWRPYPSDGALDVPGVDDSELLLLGIGMKNGGSRPPWSKATRKPPSLPMLTADTQPLPS